MPVCKYVVLFWAVLLAAAPATVPDGARIAVAAERDSSRQALRFDSDRNVFIDDSGLDALPDSCGADSREIRIVRQHADVTG